MTYSLTLSNDQLSEDDWKHFDSLTKSEICGIQDIVECLKDAFSEIDIKNEKCSEIGEECSEIDEELSEFNEEWPELGEEIVQCCFADVLGSESLDDDQIYQNWISRIKAELKQKDVFSDVDERDYVCEDGIRYLHLFIRKDLIDKRGLVYDEYMDGYQKVFDFVPLHLI